MSARFKIDSAKLTVVLTSCGRFDLLEETVASFLKHFDTDRIVIADDAGDPGAAARFGSKFSQAEMRVNAPKLGQMRSIDALYASVQTPYVAHLEDDWKFSGGVDLDKVVRFLEARPDVSVVCIGYRLDERFKQCARKTTQVGIDYWVWDLDAHPKWFSYSFNPSVGRPPTPAELACSDPVNPCLIESFLTSDPPLKQVVSRTFELGLRGKETYWNDGRLEWSAGLFHAMNFDDILPLAAPETGRGFFANVGDTLRGDGVCQLRARRCDDTDQRAAACTQQSKRCPVQRRTR
jgi:hypothetical protein